MGTWVVLLETSCVPFGSPIEMGAAAVGVADEKDSVTKCRVQAESRAAVRWLGIGERIWVAEHCCRVIEGW